MLGHEVSDTAWDQKKEELRQDDAFPMNQNAQRRQQRGNPSSKGDFKNDSLIQRGQFITNQMVICGVEENSQIKPPNGIIRVN